MQAPFGKPPLDGFTVLGVPLFALAVVAAIAFWLWHEWYVRFGPGREDRDGDEDRKG